MTTNQHKKHNATNAANTVTAWLDGFTAATEEVAEHRFTRISDPLGIYTKRASLFSPEKRPALIGKVLSHRGDIALPDPKDQVANRLERWALQSVARHALPNTRTAACMRNRAKGCSHVVVKWSASSERASYANLQVCGSVWACPVCAAKISEHRRKELIDLMESHTAAGGFAYLVTRTFSHKSSSDLEELQNGLKVAEKNLKSGKYWQSMKADFGFVGTVRALEVTLASASGGWHPHIHELWFVDRKLSTVEQEELRARMFDKWSKACAAAGLGAPSEDHGVDVRGGKDAARYISKWGMASELTKGHVKNSAKGLSPFDLLRLGLHTSDTSVAGLARDLFAEYAQAMKGRQQLVWSQGLRKRYDVLEVDDAEVVEGIEPDAEALGRLDTEQWRAILRTNRRGHLLEVVNASKGQWVAASVFIAQAVADYETQKGMGEAHESEAKPTAVDIETSIDAGHDVGTQPDQTARHDKQGIPALSVLAQWDGHGIGPERVLEPFSELASVDVSTKTPTGLVAAFDGSQVPKARPRQGSPDRVWPHFIP